MVEVFCIPQLQIHGDNVEVNFHQFPQLNFLSHAVQQGEGQAHAGFDHLFKGGCVLGLGRDLADLDLAAHEQLVDAFEEIGLFERHHKRKLCESIRRE